MQQFFAATPTRTLTGRARARDACSADYKVPNEYSGDDVRAARGAAMRVTTSQLLTGLPTMRRAPSQIKWHRAGRPFGCAAAAASRRGSC